MMRSFFWTSGVSSGAPVGQQSLDEILAAMSQLRAKRDSYREELGDISASASASGPGTNFRTDGYGGAAQGSKPTAAPRSNAVATRPIPGEFDKENGGQSMADDVGAAAVADEPFTYDPTTGKNVKVVIRVRPPLPRELESHFQNVVHVDSTSRVMTISEPLNGGYGGNPDVDENAVYAQHSFTFDHVYDQSIGQSVVYNGAARESVHSTLQGYNATIIAYGQTGTGKTYTMEGFTKEEHRGIIPRSIEEVFGHIENCEDPATRFLVRASYLQIYNEVISDLLKPERTHLHIREDRRRGVFVEGLSEWVVRSPSEIYGLMTRGASVRATGATKMNEISSRSHAIFTIIVEQSHTITGPDGAGGAGGGVEDMDAAQAALAAGGILPPGTRQKFLVGKLYLVDLAGSERVRLSGATGRRLEESKKINQSLSALGNVISALTDTKGRQHIPYRDSKLTRILEDSLGGNCKTTMCAMISPALEAFVESLSTLKFANRAKNIKNEAHVNEDLDQKALLRKYERELKKLRAELEKKSREVVDKRKVLELEEEKRRAERDKLAALNALEAKSREFMREKEEKRLLEQRISQMQSQMLMGGKNPEDTPAFRTALQQEQVRIQKDYEVKLADLERERQSIEEDKAQVDRYKILLLKQRDIMVALTSKLNEKDQSILSLQEELDAYDRHQRLMEEKLDQKTADLIYLQHHMHEQAEKGGAGGGGAAGGGAGGNTISGGNNGSSSSKIYKAHASGAQDAANGSVLVDSDSPSDGGGGGMVDGGGGLVGGRSNHGMHGAHSKTNRLLNADEKVDELEGLLRQSEQGQAAVAEELSSIKAEKASLESLLRNKMEALVEKEYRDRLGGLQAELEQWKASHQTAEEKRRATEYVLELSKMNGEDPMFQARLADILKREKSEMERPMSQTLERAKSELAKKDAELSQREAMVRKLQSELDNQHHYHNGGNGNGGNNNNNHNGNGNGDVSALQAALKDKADELSELSANYAALRNKVEAREVPRLEEDNKRLAQQCRINAMERSHLQTVLSTKIKTYVDRLADETHGRDDGVANTLRSLQSIVNRAVTALQGKQQQSGGGGGGGGTGNERQPPSSVSASERERGDRGDRGSADRQQGNGSTALQMTPGDRASGMQHQGQGEVTPLQQHPPQPQQQQQHGLRGGGGGAGGGAASQLSYALANGSAPSAGGSVPRLPPSQQQHAAVPVVETLIAQRQAELREKLRQQREN